MKKFIVVVLFFGVCATGQIRGPLLGEEGKADPVTINVSSLTGIHQNSNLTTGGGTDDTAIIQAALDAHLNGLVLVQDGVSLITGLNLHSNQTLKCADTLHGFYLANSSNREMVRNLHRSGSVIQDSNITLNGCYYNGNKANQSGVSQADNTPMTGFGFYGVSNLTIKNLTVFNASAWEIGIGNYFNVTVTNCSLTASTTISNLNTDGIDLRGPGYAATLSNLTILSGDDAVALNARNYVSTLVGPYILGGDITNTTINSITIQNTSGTGTFGGVDFIADATHTVRDVYASSVSGTVANYALYLNRDVFNSAPTAGLFSNIFATGFSVTQAGTRFGGQIPDGLYLVDGTVDYISLSNFTPFSQLVKLPTNKGIVTSLIVNDQQLGPLRGGPVYVGTAGTFVQGVAKALVTSVSSNAQAYALNVTQGDLLVVFGTIFFSGGTTMTIADTLGNTWTAQATFSDGGTGHLATVWTAVANATGADTVTLTFGTSVAASTMEVAEYGGQPASFLDVMSSINLNTASTTSVTAPTVTTSQANDAVLGIGSGNGGTTTPGGGYTLELGGGTALDVLVDTNAQTAGNYTPSWSWATVTSGSYGATMAIKSTAGLATSWGISGSTGVAGAIVTYTGTASGSVTADSFGNYNITGLANGTYTVTPSMPGSGDRFFPAGASVPISNADVTGIVFSTP